MESRKMGTDELISAGQQWRHEQREQTGDTVGEGQNGRNWENSAKTCTLPFVKDIASGNLLCDRGS